VRALQLIGPLVALIALESLFYYKVDWTPWQERLARAAESIGLTYNTVIVLAGTGLLGLTSGIVGSFAVLRRRALVSDAVSHAALPGLCIAFLIIKDRNFAVFLAGATLSGLLGVGIISWLQNNTRIKADAAIGIVLGGFFGLGIALSRIIQDDPTGRQAGLDSYLLGKTAGMVSQDLFLISAVALNVLVVVLLLYKEFKLISFDTSLAAVLGWPVLFLDMLLMAMVVITTVVGLPAVGVVLMSALLIIPGVSARFWTEKLSNMLWLAAGFGLLTGVFGTWLSSQYSRLPAGPLIVLSGAGIFLFSMLFAPRRGILARFIQHFRLERRVAQQNLMRCLYELSEDDLPERRSIPLDEIVGARSWSRSEALGLLRRAAGRGDAAEMAGGHWRLTEQGLQAAANIVRTHRLWEIYLVEQAAVAADHVDRDADEIEHMLKPELIAELDAKLRAEGRFPTGTMPQSIHPLQAVKEAR
jgi:manganese/zinc/iron transport system permease protein